MEWKKIRAEVKKEHKEQGYAGRFGPGLPRVTDRIKARIEELSA